MRIAHISDIHLRALRGVRPWSFVGQRLLGGANLLLNRAREYPPDVPRALLADIAQLAPDHLLVSGDLTNLSFRAEFERVLEFLAQLPLGPGRITVVPGNHDAYTYGGLLTRDFERLFAAYLDSDVVLGSGVFPLVHLRQNVAMIGLSTARPSPPLLAIGTLGSRQLDGLSRALEHPEVRCRFRLVVLHHAPLSPPARWSQRLTDADQLLEVLRQRGADLVVHGHLHRNLRHDLSGPGPKPIPLIGINSSTWVSPQAERRASYNVYEIDEQGLLAQIERRRYEPETQRFVADAEVGGPVTE